MNNLLANHRIRIKEKQVLHIRRSLSGVGKIRVRQGQEVSPEDILGEAESVSGFIIVHLAQSLGVSHDDAPKLLQKKIGQKIFKGELLARKRGLFGEKVLTSPTDGIIQSYNREQGQLMIKYPPKRNPLVSGVYGIVDDVTGNDVLIKTLSNVILGVMGVGRERGGLLNVLGSSSILFGATHIPKMYPGHIMVVGALIYGETLKQAASIRVGGIISGGLNARDFKAMSSSLQTELASLADPGLAVVATEGFGALSIGEDIFSLLKKHHGQFALIDGQGSRILLPVTDAESIMEIRKVALPLNVLSKVKGAREERITLGTIKPGVRVRIIWPPFAGWQGIVESVDQRQTIIDSGLATILLTVESRTRKIRVPYPNIELI